MLASGLGRGVLAFTLTASAPGVAVAQLTVDPAAVPPFPPGTFLTIGAAIAGSAPGNTILVRDNAGAPFTYVETVSYPYDLVIQADPNNQSPVTIQAPSPAPPGAPATGFSTVTFNVLGNILQNSVLDGFTITGGTGTPQQAGSFTIGGGILIIEAMPTIRNCLIQGNSTTGPTVSAHGAGIYAEHPYSGGVPTLLVGPGVRIENCRIEGNGAGGNGGAVFTSHIQTLIANCRIRGNDADLDGGGILVDGFANDIPVTSVPVQILQCQIQDNTAQRFGGGVKSQEGGDPLIEDCEITGNDADTGGGVMIDSSRVTLRNSSIVLNTGYTRGGGLDIMTDAPTSANPNSVIEHCTIARNTTDLQAFSDGGGVFILSGNSGPPTFDNCLIVLNRASEGGAIATFQAEFIMQHCTVAQNSAQGGFVTGGMLLGQPSAPNNTLIRISNSIVYDNLSGPTAPAPTPAYLREIGDGPYTSPPNNVLTVSFSDVQGTAGVVPALSGVPLEA